MSNSKKKAFTYLRNSARLLFAFSLVGFDMLKINLNKECSLTIVGAGWGRGSQDTIFLPPANEVAGRLCFHGCLWLCSQGGLPHCMLGYTPWDQRQAPPPAGTPPLGQVHPHLGTPPRQAHPNGAVHAGIRSTSERGTHPTGMQSCAICDHTRWSYVEREIGNGSQK